MTKTRKMEKSYKTKKSCIEKDTGKNIQNLKISCIIRLCQKKPAKKNSHPHTFLFTFLNGASLARC